MLKSLVLSLLGVFIYNLSFSTHIIVSGNVSGNWDSDTVFVADNIQVPSGQMLYYTRDKMSY